MDSSPKLGLHLKRPCLLVADLDQSLRLYQATLGFRLDYVGIASPDSYLYQVFQLPPSAQLRFAALSTEHELRALALTEVKGIELPSNPVPHRIATVIQVADVAELISQVQVLGLSAIAPTQFTAPPDLTFTEQGFYDFDGHLIVLYDVAKDMTKAESAS
ncbi:MAG: VOC family protein [Leptolyngbya sp. SIO4C1]|nr:VOC family protein [Leptolyngbya sp. SIO4C1]